MKMGDLTGRVAMNPAWRDPFSDRDEQVTNFKDE